MNRLLLCLLPFLMLSCTPGGFLSGPQLEFVYDDFGPEAVASSWLGPRRGSERIIVHHGGSHDEPGVRYVNITRALRGMKASARNYPRTEDNSATRSRMEDTYARIYHLYRTRRDAVLAGPFSSYGRGGINRAMIMPPMPPSL